MPTERALEAFHNAVLAAEQRKYLIGFIGKIDPTATSGVVIDVPGRTGYVYVRISNGVEVHSVVEAYNAGAIRNPNIMVRVERRPTGLVIVGADPSSAIAVLGEDASSASVPPHSHSIASGTPDMVEGLRFLPGLMRPATGDTEPGGLYVYVEEFNYDGGYWIGDTFLMTPPATSGKQAWCMVALNPADGTLYQLTGADQPTTFTLPALLIADIAVPTGYIPVGAVVLQNGQTEITGNETWNDCRYHYAQAGGDIGNFVTLTPDSDTRNTVQPAGDHPALILKNNGSQTDAPLQVQTSAGAVMAQISAAGGLTVNEQGADADTRIEGDTDANLLFVDASTDRVGIGTATPGVKLDVSGAITGTGLDINGDGAIRKLLTDASTGLTISAGVITVTQTFHRVDTEAAAVSDNLSTINGMTDGQLLILRAENAGREVVVDTAGNITTSDGNNIALDETYKLLFLIYDGNASKVRVVGGGVVGGAGSYYQTVRSNGTPLTQRAALNLIQGTNVTLTIADDAANGETDVTIAASGGGAASPGMKLYRWQQFS